MKKNRSRSRRRKSRSSRRRKSRSNSRKRKKRSRKRKSRKFGYLFKCSSGAYQRYLSRRGGRGLAYTTWRRYGCPV